MIRRKERILISALELLEAGGVNNVTTKKMAERQGITEPALYRQYKNKSAIITGIIEEYAAFDDQIMATIEEAHMDGITSVKFYVQRFSELYTNYSEITTVMYSMDVYFYEDRTRNRMKTIQAKRLVFLEKLIGEGQKDGTITNTMAPALLADMVDGLIYTQIYRWRMNDKEGNVGLQLLTMAEQLLSGGVYENTDR